MDTLNIVGATCLSEAFCFSTCTFVWFACSSNPCIEFTLPPRAKCLFSSCWHDNTLCPLLFSLDYIFSDSLQKLNCFSKTFAKTVNPNTPWYWFAVKSSKWKHVGYLFLHFPSDWMATLHFVFLEAVTGFCSTIGKTIFFYFLNNKLLILLASSVDTCQIMTTERSAELVSKLKLVNYTTN